MKIYPTPSDVRVPYAECSQGDRWPLPTGNVLNLYVDDVAGAFNNGVFSGSANITHRLILALAPADNRLKML